MSSTTAAGTGGAGGGGGASTGGAGTGTGGSGGAGGAGGGVGSAPVGPYALAYAGTSIGVDLRQPTSATFSGSALAGYVANANEQPLIGTNTTSDVFAETAGGAVPLVVSGRWSGGTLAGDFYGNQFTFPTDGGLQYVIGTETGALPASGAPTYMLSHASPTTVSDGTLAPGSSTGDLGVLFAGDGTHVGVTLQLTMPGDQTYDITTTGGAAIPGTSELTIFPAGSSLFSGVVHPVSTTGACSGTVECKAVIDGFFAGASAEVAALVVHVYNNAGGSAKTVSAAMVFTKE
jgi:hypothetical protein